MNTNLTPVVGTIEVAGKTYNVHAATMRQVMTMAHAAHSGDLPAQLDAADAILNACVEGLEAPSMALDSATAGKALALATGSEKPSPDFTQGTATPQG